jgi:F0F1-type ATP synthase membrane subunit b/b'
MDYLSELNIRCDFHPRGCREIVKLKNLEQHVASCGFSPVQCLNDGCNALVSIRDKIYHQSEVCEFRKSKCHDCGQLKQEVKELRVQMMAQQDQMKEEMKEEMKGMKDNVKNQVKQEIKELTFQMLTRYDLLLAQQKQMQADIKGIKEEVKNEVQREMKVLTVQMLSCQDQTEMKSEFFTRQDQMKEDLKGIQNDILVISSFLNDRSCR